MRSILAWLAAALFATTEANARKPVVIGYVPAFKGFDDVVDRADFTHYTHVDIAFVNPGPAGEIFVGDSIACAPAGPGVMISEEGLKRTVAKAHHAGAKVLVSVGGGTIPACSGDWAMLAGREMRSKLVANLLELVDRYRLDGIDVDLEGELMTRMDREGNYTPLIRELSAGLRTRGKLLTCATASYDGGMVPDASLPYFDLIGIMSYDAIGPSWGTPGDEHSSFDQAERDLALWRGKGVPAAKLALGLPFYGRGYGSYRPNWALHEIAAEQGEAALQADVVGQRCADCSYITYNGLPTLQRKARLAASAGAGVMVWEVDEDLADHRAIKAVNAAIREGRENGR